MSNKIKNVLEEYVQGLFDIIGKNLKQVILYGSYARGDQNQNGEISDIDIMILVDLNEEEIKVVLAHECGHIACRHVLYHTMARMVLGAGSAIPGMDLLTTALKFALFHWERCSEFSCDRAAAIVMEDPGPVARVMSLLASGSEKISSQINMELYMEQAKEYQHLLDRSNWDKALQYLALMNQSHPFLSVRAAEINNWCKTRAYENIIAYIHEEGGDRCPVCGTVIQEEWMFCRQCGTKLK